MYAIFLKLLNENRIRTSAVAKATGISNMTFSDWKNGKSTPKADKMKKIADYFGVSLAYLASGEEESEKKETTLTPKDERDIAKDLDNMMKKIKSGEDGPLRYNGEDIDEESLLLLQDAIGMSLRHLKVINKEKYNPNKNKK